METLKNKLKLSEKIVSLFTDYLDKLAPLLEDYGSEYSKLSDEINNFPKLHKKLVEACDKLDVKSDNLANTAFDIYGSFMLLQNNADKIASLINEPHIQPENISMSNLSQTYKIETAETLHKLLVQYYAFKKQTSTIQQALIEEFAQLLLQKELGNQEIQHIRELFYANPTSISLYVYIMQEFILKNDDEQYLIWIEEDKDFILSNLHKDKIKTKDLHLKSPSYERFKLTPVTKSMSESDLLKLMSKNSVTNTTFKVYAKEHKCQFIRKYSVISQPTEYNIDKLIFKNQAKDYIQPQEYGINGKFIDRFDIVNINYKPHKWNFAWETTGKLDDKLPTYIVETLDGDNWRLLSHTYTFDPLPTTLYRQVKNFISEDNGPRRVTNYQAGCITKSIPNMFLKRNIDMESIEEEASNIPSQVIRTELYFSMVAFVRDEIIGKEYQNGKLIRSVIDINNILHSPKMSTHFVDCMMGLYHLGSNSKIQKEFSGGKFPFYETLNTYIVNMYSLSHRFMKELHDKFNRGEPIENFTTAEITKKINSILEEVINNLISDDNNIYTMVNHKHLLLNL
jgi:hypothetical protein